MLGLMITYFYLGFNMAGLFPNKTTAARNYYLRILG